MERDPVEMALSTDIVMDVVLSHLKARDLLCCRLTSKFWNKAASTVLRKRSTMIKTLSSEEDLMELEGRMKQSSDFPFTGLNCHVASQFHSARAVKFFQNYGDRFTRLRTTVDSLSGVHHLDPFINHLTRLLILEVALHHPSCIMIVGLAAPKRKVLKLPSVRTIRFLGPCCESVLEEVFPQVVTAASPSVRIECLDVNAKIVRGLKNGGGLRSVSLMKLATEEDATRTTIRTEMDQLLSTASPSLTKLDFHNRGCLSLKGLEKILSSSQHTLKELHLDGSWLSKYTWENLPVLARLTKLSLTVLSDFGDGSLFRGRHGNKFPLLKELRLRFRYDNRYRNVGPVYPRGFFVVPTVTRLDLEGFFCEDGMKQLAQTFPNATEMRLEYGYYSGDIDMMPRIWENLAERNPFEIWSVGEFKFLEKLTVWGFTIKRPKQNYINMDSFLTGIPFGICENLHRQEQLVSFLINSPFKQAFCEALRVNPSVLQLKSLKELIVCVNHEDGFVQAPEDTPLMSMLSVWCALEIMPNLRAKFVYEDWSPSHGKPDKTVLEDVFKHMREYVTLEPFFY